MPPLKACELLITLCTPCLIITSRQPERHDRYLKAYNSILALVPGFRDTLNELADEHAVDNLVKMVSWYPVCIS